MIWPGALVNSALFNTLHKSFGKRDRGHMTRERFFLIAVTCSFVFAPSEPITFGILHCIAVASLLAGPFVTAPAWASVAIGLGAIAAPFFIRSTLFDPPWLLWLGLLFILAVYFAPTGIVGKLRARSDSAPDPKHPLPKFSPPRRVPHGVTLIGRLFDEGTIVQAGMAMETAFGVAGERPKGF